MKDIIIFDYDGVIADSLDFVILAYNELAFKYNLDKIKKKEEFTDFFNGNFFDGLKNIGIEEDFLKKIVNELANKINKNIDKTPIFKGIKEVLDKLSKSYRLLIVTSNLSCVIEKSLVKNNINSIEAVIGSDEEKSKIKKLEKIKKNNLESKIYYIGDTTGDIYEGREAGVTTVAVSWGFHSRDKLKKSEPDYIVNSPKEILNIFLKYE